MALTSNDETDLLLPLYRGLDETPRFATFLDRLRRRTGAQLVDVVVESDVDATAGLGLLPTDQAVRNALRPFRVAMFPLRTGSQGWLVIGRARPCSAADSALISSLVPYVQSVTAASIEAQRERATAALSAGGLERTGTGWILFDSELRVIDIESHTRDHLNVLTGWIPTTGERLRGISAAAERRLAAVAEGDGTSGYTSLTHELRTDAVIEKIDPGSSLNRAFPKAKLIAWCRFEKSDHGRRIDALSGLFNLPPREAEFAMAMADGLSIAEVGTQMGLTLETARNYSKQLYAKLDVSGQAQLVRLVQRSGAVLA
jgi:DNA-binding CsgD family transcriptional regulator